LALRLRKQGVEVTQQHPLSFYDEDGTLLGEFFANLFIENRLIVELKGVRAVLHEHLAHCGGRCHIA
jgi:GxxExxY protein